MPDAQQGASRYVYLPAAVAAIGGLLFGFDTAVINGAIVFLKSQFGLSDSQTEIAASSLLLGCVVGASLAAFTSDRFGRKRVLLAAAALFTVSSLGSALPRDLTQFVIARVIGGLAIGIASTLSPLYIAEISPAKSRGLMVSLNQLAIVIGILLSYSVNYLLTGAGPANWRWMFASAAVPSICFLIALLFISESPRWLVQKGREREAEHFLSQMVGSEAASGRDQGHSGSAWRKKVETSSIPISENRWWLRSSLLCSASSPASIPSSITARWFFWNMCLTRPLLRRFGLM